MRVVQTATIRILRHRFPGASETVGQVFKFVWRLHWKINAVCMSLSPLVSFKSRFVTYLLNFPLILHIAYVKENHVYTYIKSYSCINNEICTLLFTRLTLTESLNVDLF